MVKIKTITHSPQSSIIHTPQTHNNFSRAREFQRALNATKLQKIFAKPLIATLEGHSDGITVIQRCPLQINRMISGAYDGQVKIWDLSQGKQLISLNEHSDIIKGVSFNNDGTLFLSCSLDKTINIYNFNNIFSQFNNNYKHSLQPLIKYLSSIPLFNIDHSYYDNQFITSGQYLQLWSYQRNKPIQKLISNIDSILHARYNKSQTHIVCGSCNDNSIILYDLRTQLATQKIQLPNKSMSLQFNPIEPMNLSIGNDDSNAYSFDIRRMQKPSIIHKGHMNAITSLKYSPTGRQFVTGSFDKTLRLFNFNQGVSKQVYHTRRMQIINAVQYTIDGHYILSGSQDMNIRLWKNVAWIPNGYINQRQQRAIDYRQKLIDKFKHTNKIRRIANYRHLPKYILNAKKRRQEQNISKFNKVLNKETNTGIKDNKRSVKYSIVEEMAIQQNKIDNQNE